MMMSSTPHLKCSAKGNITPNDQNCEALMLEKQLMRSAANSAWCQLWKLAGHAASKVHLLFVSSGQCQFVQLQRLCATSILATMCVFVPDQSIHSLGYVNWANLEVCNRLDSSSRPCVMAPEKETCCASVAAFSSWGHIKWQQWLLV